MFRLWCKDIYFLTFFRLGKKISLPSLFFILGSPATVVQINKHSRVLQVTQSVFKNRGTVVLLVFLKSDLSPIPFQFISETYFIYFARVSLLTELFGIPHTSLNSHMADEERRTHSCSTLIVDSLLLGIDIFMLFRLRNCIFKHQPKAIGQHVGVIIAIATFTCHCRGSMKYRSK